MDSISELNKRKNEIMQELDKMLAGKTDAQRIAIKKTNDEYKEQIGLLKEVNSQLSGMKQSSHDRVDTLASEQKALKGLTGLQQSLVGFEKTKIESLLLNKKLNGGVYDKIQKISGLNKELAGLSSEESIQRSIIKEKLKDEYNSLKGARGIHAQIRNNMMEESEIADGIASLSEKQQSILNGQIEVYEKLQKTIDGTLDTVKLLFGNFRAGLGMSITAIGHLEHKISGVNKELGFTLMDMNSAAKSAGVLSFVFDDTVGTVKALSAEFGTLDEATFSTQANIGLIASNMGISNTDAVALTANFARMNEGSTSVAADMIKTTSEYAKQNNVIPSQVLSDLAGSAETFAIFAKDGGENMIKAATGAARLGTNLSTVSGIADNLLDFESSMTKELELGAMLGKNINLNKARQLAYDGKIVEATQETLKQVGGIEAFNRMDYYQKKQTADLLGVSVAELKKMGENQKNIGTMGEVVNTKFSKWGESISMVTTKYLGHGIEALGGMVTASAQVGANFTRLGFPLDSVGKKISGIVGSLASGAKQLASKGWQMLMGKTGGIAESVGTKGIAEKTKFNSSKITTGKSGKRISSFSKGISSINPTKLIAGAAALVIAASAVWVLGKGIQQFKDIGWEQMAKAGASIIVLTGIVMALGAVMSSGAGAVAIVLGAAALLVMSVSILALGIAVQTLASGFSTLSTMSETITGLIGMIGGIGLLSVAFAGLAGSLGLLGLAGIAALPALMGLSLAAPVLSTMANIFGTDDSKTETTAIVQDSVSEYEIKMLGKMDTLIKAVSLNKDVYLDKEKVTSIVMKQSEKSTGNIFGLGVA